MHYTIIFSHENYIEHNSFNGAYEYKVSTIIGDCRLFNNMENAYGIILLENGKI